MMTSHIDGYHAVYFEDVASAVEFCRELVPHIVQPIRGERAVVWFHVPPRSTNSTSAGCYLFASDGAIAAAQRAELDTPLCGRVPRSALPVSSVLLFGEDAPPVPPRVGRNGARKAPSPYPRSASRPVDAGV